MSRRRGRKLVICSTASRMLVLVAGINKRLGERYHVVTRTCAATTERQPDSRQRLPIEKLLTKNGLYGILERAKRRSSARLGRGRGVGGRAKIPRVRLETRRAASAAARYLGKERDHQAASTELVHVLLPVARDTRVVDSSRRL